MGGKGLVTKKKCLDVAKCIANQWSCAAYEAYI